MTDIDTPLTLNAILVVDDDLINREIVCHMVKKIATTVLTAENGQQAVEAVHTCGPFDLVLMDLNMPVKNGFDAAKEIRALPQVSQPVIVALSGDNCAETLTKCQQAGIDDHLAKPFSKQQLLAMMAKALK